MALTLYSDQGYPLTTAQLDENFNSTTIHVATVAALRALGYTPAADTLYSTLGYTTAGDGGQANYRWDSASTDTDDGGLTIKITAVTTGRFKLVYEGFLNVLWFGAKGDGVTTGQQAAFNAASAVSKYIRVPPGSYIFSGGWLAQSGSVIDADSWENTRIYRSGAWSGPTLQIGANTAGLGSYAFSVKGLYFEQLHPGFVQGTSTTMVDRLTGGQVHLQAYGGTNGRIEDCWFQHAPYSIRASGCTNLKIDGCIFVGSWDDANANISETEAHIVIENSVTHGISTLNKITNCYIAGGPLVSRQYTIGDVTWTAVREGGAKFGVLVYGFEGLHIENNYIGGHNQYSILFLPTAGDINSNLYIGNNFFDGAILGSILFSAAGAAGYCNIINIVNNRFNGQLSNPRVLQVNSNAGAYTAAMLTFSGNITNAHTETPLYLDGLKGGKIANNLVAGYNARGVGSTTPGEANAARAAGCYILGVSRNVDFIGNTWGGGINDMDTTNDCRWGIVLDGGATYPTTISAGLETGVLGRTGGELLSGFTKSFNYDVYGTGSVLSGNTSAVVTHNLGYIPNIGRIFIVGGELPTNTIRVPYITNITSTDFTVNIGTDPGASGWDFGWSVR